MKTIMDLLRKPLIKIIGLLLVLYFGLMRDKTNPDGLGNRLSSEQISKNFNEAQEKSTFILSNIENARKLRGGNVAAPAAENVPQQNLSVITIKDTAVGDGEDMLKCGDEAEISYEIRVVGSNGHLEFVPKEKLLIGSNVNQLLERKIIGMKIGGTRLVNIPHDFKSSNQKLAFLLKFNESDLQYSVVLHSFSATDSNKLHCSIIKDEPNKDAK